MYLSTLLIDIGDNPDRPRPGRTWLGNLYHVHQRLCMAFPSALQQSWDPEFLKPFEPCGFRDTRPEQCGTGADPNSCPVSAEDRPVHAPRDTDHNFLFRIDPRPGGNPVILVQSAIDPNWDYAFHSADFLRAAQVKEYNPVFANGQSLKFLLVANATKKVDTKTRADGTKSNGSRVPVKFEELGAWLARQGERGGFSFADESVLRQPGYVYVRKTGKEMNRLFSVRFDGVLTVSDPDAFRETLVRGIGPAKAFGFGLLSVAPVRGR